MSAQAAHVPVAPMGHSTPKLRSFAISGAVEDQSGAVIPAAELFFLDPTTGQSRRAVSDNSGHFVFEDVLPGHYLLRGKAEDMQSTETEITVATSAVDVKLQMAVTVEERVQVSAADGIMSDCESKLITACSQVGFSSVLGSFSSEKLNQTTNGKRPDKKLTCQSFPR